MILIDPRDGGAIKRPGVDLPSDQFLRYLTGMNLEAQKSRLNLGGDFAFEGNLKQGRCLIGVERKTLHDMLNCIDDHRFNEQRVEMKLAYAKSYLILEGEWKPHDETLILMQGFRDKDNRTSWGFLKHKRDRYMYSNLYNYLLSVMEAGVILTYSRNIFHTAVNVAMIYRYYQKAWHQHRAMSEIHKPNIPTLDRHPSLVRRWAADIDDIGVIYSAEAQRVFKTPRRLAMSDEEQWMSIRGVGRPTAEKIMRQIYGDD